MALTDLRQQSQARTQDQEVDGKIIDPQIREAVERLFDIPQIVPQFENLLDENKLNGCEVLRIDQEMPPILITRHVARPAIREKIKTFLEKGGGNFTIRPDPELEIITTVGLPGVRVSPTDNDTVVIEYIPAARGVSGSGEDALDSVREDLDEKTYMLVVQGVRYPIERIDGAILELDRPIEFNGSQHGLIYNGANRFLMELTRVESVAGEFVKQRQSKDEVRGVRGRPIPMMKTKTLPGGHEVSVVGKNDQSSVEKDEDIQFNAEFPPAPEVGEVFYTFGRPERDAPGANKLNSTITRLGLSASLQHPPENAAKLIGLRYRVATKSGDEWKYGRERYDSIYADSLQWQLEEAKKDDGDTRGLTFEMGEYSSGHKRRVEVKFVDELGRVVSMERIDKDPVNPKDGELVIHQDLPDRFEKFVDGASVPLRTDVRSFYDDADAEIETLKTKAEEIIENKALEESSTQQFEPPTARLKLEATGGRTVEAQGAQSGHPNGLDMEYRFSWTGDGPWDTGFGGPNRSFTFDESGTKVVTMQVRGEVDQSDIAKATIVLPKPTLDLSRDSSGNKTIKADASGSIKQDGTTLEFRYAYEFWDEKTVYSAGDVVYYGEAETIYEAGTTTTKGAAPTDATSEWSEVAFSSTTTDTHSYDSGGEKPVIVQAKDNRGAFGQTIEYVHVPSVEVDLRLNGSELEVRAVGEEPAGHNLEYQFDWDISTSGYDTGLIDALPVTHDYGAEPGDTDINIAFESPNGLRDEQVLSLPNISPDLVASAVAGTNGQRYTLDASGSTASNSNSNLEFRFDYEGDGTWDTGWSTGATTQHTYDRETIFLPRVEVREPSLEISDTAGADVLSFTMDPSVQGRRVTVDAEVIEESYPGEVIEYKYEWTSGGGYTDWLQVGRRSHSYAASRDSADISLKIRRPNSNPGSEYVLTGAVYWPSNLSFSYGTNYKTMTNISLSASAPAGAPWSATDLEYQIDFGDGERTTSWLEEGLLPSSYQYTSGLVHTYTVRARSPNGSITEDTGEITLDSAG